MASSSYNANGDHKLEQVSSMTTRGLNQDGSATATTQKADNTDLSIKTSGKTIDDLPNELLLYIVSAVTQTKDFHSLCSTSRRFYSIAQPFLYRYYREHVFGFSFNRYLCTILQRADLASHVKSLVLLDWHCYDWHCYDWYQEASWMGPPHQGSTLFGETMQNIYVGDQELSSYLGIGTAPEVVTDAKVALLLARMPKIEELELHIAPEYEDIPLPLQLMHDSALSIQPSQNQFRALRRISITQHEDPYNIIIWEYISALLVLPSLRTFEISGFCDVQNPQREGTWSCFPGQSPVEHIKLVAYVDLKMCTMNQLLQSPRALKSFTWECDEAYEMACDAEVTFRELGRILQHQKQSLESLIITGDDAFHLFPNPSIQSLVDFARLKFIDLPIGVLREVDDVIDPVTGSNALGGVTPFFDRLPTSVESLTLSDLWYYEIGTELDDFEKVRPLRFPNLQEVEFPGYPEDDEDDSVSDE